LYLRRPLRATIVQPPVVGVVSSGVGAASAAAADLGGLREKNRVTLVCLRSPWRCSSGVRHHR
jgi:hypothetical protein